MKDRGVLITILLILVLGVGITFRMHQFVTENSSPAVLTEQEAAEEDAEETVGATESPVAAALMADLGSGSGLTDGSNFVSEEGQTVPETQAAATMERAMPEEAEEEAFEEAEGKKVDSGMGRMSNAAAGASEALQDIALTEQEAVSQEETVMSPLSPAPAGSATEEGLTAADYQKKLEDVDRIVKELRETDSTANTTDSVKNIAEYEYRLWDTELNRIYQAVIAGMTESEAKQLRSEERQWIRTREQTAKQAAAKIKGGTMESLEYTASLSVSTRERAYELLEDYGDVLSPGSKKE